MADRTFVLLDTVLVFLALLCILGTVSAVDGNWGEWLEWEQCSASCGKGERKRLRFCNNPPVSHGGAPCKGRTFQVTKCDSEHECPVDGVWSEWSMWTACSVTCGEGIRSRFRECDSPPPANGGRNCDGSTDESMMCVTSMDCPRDGKWSGWSQWSSCSVTCGDGSAYRYRECNNPPPSQNGRQCAGTNQQARVCKAQRKCSVNGHWSDWSEWSACSVTCGVGVRKRWRKCDNPIPQNGGKNCDIIEAGEMQELSCNGSVVFCPVNGGWSDWGDWGDCFSPNCLSQDNLAAYTMRKRTCNNPYPSHKGSMCQGTFLNAGMCEIPTNCPVDGDWSEWSKWECSREFVTRKRECNNPAPSNGGKKCLGNKVETFLREDAEYKLICPNMPEEEPEDKDKKDEDGNEEKIEEEEDYEDDYEEDE